MITLGPPPKFHGTRDILDPLFSLDPIYQSITDGAARDRLLATYDHDLTEHEWATGYRWDIVLTGGHATPMEQEHDDE